MPLDAPDAQLVEIQGSDVWITVDKVSYNPSHVLGTGTNGTVVYRGKFGPRDVAVKRVLLEFDIYREVELLIESDGHINVTRYICTESNTHFRFIALELCLASLYDHVEKKKNNYIDMSSMEILRQSTEGLAHLHENNIVHRDLKPQNVLFSASGIGRTIVKISDFGISKKVRPGKNVLTRTRELAGSDGYMAPEELMNRDTSYSMDIFSLGCIFYYVLTGGFHPFGEDVHRNGNVKDGNHSLKELAEDQHCLSINIISRAISHSPTDRPSAKSILMHPFFWDIYMQLYFFGYASNKLTRESGTSIVMERLEKNRHKIVKKNWGNQICVGVMEDLRKFRQYDENSVRDLLRAIRNLISHYEERSANVQMLLGAFPQEFIVYFTSRFPELLLHVYDVMMWYAEESVLFRFYSDEARIQARRDREEIQKKIEEDKAKEITKKETKAVASTTPSSPISKEPQPIPKAEMIVEKFITGTTNLNVPPVRVEVPKNAGISVFEKLKRVDGAVVKMEPNPSVQMIENWIGKLSDFCAQNKLPLPEYKLEETGPDNMKIFTCYVSVGACKENGSGKKKKDSKTEAAKKLFGAIQTHGAWVGMLAEYCLKNKLPEPTYRDGNVETDPDNAKIFITHATVGPVNEIGSAKKKKWSKAAAARKLYAIVRDQVDSLLLASDQWEGKTIEIEAVEEAEEPIEGILAENGVDVSRARTVSNPQKEVETILSDKDQFLTSDPPHRCVFCGDGMDTNSARDDAARAALVHLLTYNQ